MVLDVGGGAFGNDLALLQHRHLRTHLVHQLDDMLDQHNSHTVRLAIAQDHIDKLA
jgi:hypothetical protein